MSVDVELRAWWNGRHARLRIWSRKGWRFKSSRAHTEARIRCECNREIGSIGFREIRLGPAPGSGLHIVPERSGDVARLTAYGGSDGVR
jgi:hypothetical protein